MIKNYRLRSTVGRSYSTGPEDTLDTKNTLKSLGYYETPSYGMTPYPDEPMFQAIEEFQDDFDLIRDGDVNPKGQTARKINEVVEHKNRILQPNGQQKPATKPLRASQILSAKPQAISTGTPKNDLPGQQLAVVGAIPIIVYEIAALFSMTLAAAYAWWLSLSAEKRRKVRKKVQDAQRNGFSEDPDDDDSDNCETLFRTDMATCRQVSKKRGKQAGVRCYSTANARYGACRAGKPRDQWPPLDVWNN
ncbi:MAG: hypothetical protein VB959_03220 [Rhodospirillales bacterium]